MLVCFLIKKRKGVGLGGRGGGRGIIVIFYEKLIFHKTCKYLKGI